MFNMKERDAASVEVDVPPAVTDVGILQAFKISLVVVFLGIGVGRSWFLMRSEVENVKCVHQKYRPLVCIGQYRMWDCSEYSLVHMRPPLLLELDVGVSWKLKTYTSFDVIDSFCRERVFDRAEIA